jgi:uncharacterized membrane protein YdjX (TVP38/TMEM64 family)
MMPDAIRRLGADLGRWLPLVLAATAGGAVVMLGGREYVAAHSRWLADLVDHWPFLAPFLYVVVDVAALMMLVQPSFCTMVGGVLFGPWLGATYALVGTTLGATGVFLAARNGLGGIAVHAGSLVGRAEMDFHADAFSYLILLRRCRSSLRS